MTEEVRKRWTEEVRHRRFCRGGETEVVRQRKGKRTDKDKS